MAIRVDPRRLSLLKELAAAEGLRPGQLVQRWVEERLDLSGVAAPAKPAVEAAAAAPVDTPTQPDASVSRLDEIRASMSRDKSGDQAAG